MTVWPILAPASLLGLLLLAAAWGDLRARTIPNSLNAAIALLAVPWWWANGVSPWPGVAIHIAGAALVFALFAGLFALRLMGGGDVKLLTALALWLDPLAIARMLVVMALAGGVLTLVVAAEHRWRARPGVPEIPYGVAIAAAGIWELTNDILTTLGH